LVYVDLGSKASAHQVHCFSIFSEPYVSLSNQLEAAMVWDLGVDQVATHTKDKWSMVSIRMLAKYEL
jgi:hypothetical protein